jgi:MFS family permease
VERAHAARAFTVYRMGMNGSQIIGAALAGALVAALGPGWVLAADAGSFALAALLRAFLRVGDLARPDRGGGLLRDLRDGWREFTSRRWLWAIVVQFSVVNAVSAAALAVYGPLLAAARPGGAGTWGIALAASGLGTVAGGFLMLRWRPRRILLAGTLCVFPDALPLLALATGAPAPVLIAAMLAGGLAIEVFGVTWMLALHQEIPEDRLSRVSAYDILGSVCLVPVGTALAGPAAGALGIPGALWGCAVLTVLLTAAVLLAPEVRKLTRRQQPDTADIAGIPGVPGIPGPAPQPTPKAPSGGSGDGTAALS